MRRIAEIFRRAGVEVAVEVTEARGSAGVQARAAICAGYDAVLPAVETERSSRFCRRAKARDDGRHSLGHRNVLAHDLGLAARAERAAAQLLGYAPHRISLGRIETQADAFFYGGSRGGRSRGAAVQGQRAGKQRGGYLAYYTHGARLLFRHPFVPFRVEITTGMTSGDTTALELVAMRVRSFGTAARWLPGSSLRSPELRLVLLRNSSRPTCCVTACRR